MPTETNKAIGKCEVCQKQTTTRCSGCAQTYYCSVDHQKQSWKDHKLNCHPFKIANHEVYGRVLIATRDIKPGEVVLKEAPLIKGPSQVTGPVCVGCLQGVEQKTYKECSRCGWPVCAQGKCQDSKTHLFECMLTQSRGSKISIQHFYTPHPTYQCLTTLRCLLLKEENKVKWGQLMTLQSHSEDRKKTPQWELDYQSIVKFIPRFFKCDKRWTEEEIMEMVGIVQVNGHEVPITSPSYVAVYHLASFLQHSCCPNISKTFADNGHLVLWAPNRIPKGEQLSICYTDALWGTMSRQSHLKETKFFDCNCKRCSDITELGTHFSSLKCFDKHCSGMQVLKTAGEIDSDWVCSKCGIEADAAQIMEILDRAGKDLQAMDKQNEGNCRKYLEHYSKWLPPHHYFMMQVKIALMELLGTGGPEVLQALPIDTLTYKIALCRELLDVCKVVSACETRLLGNIEFELHAALTELGRRENIAQHECYSDILEESLIHAEEAHRLLSPEPVSTFEGKIAAQAKINADSIKIMLGL